jgi:hypothetical protein
MKLHSIYLAIVAIAVLGLSHFTLSGKNADATVGAQAAQQPAAMASSDEDSKRCPCWYNGFDEFGKKITPEDPASGINDCDLHGQKLEYMDGYKTARDKGERKCPYKA